MKFSCPAVACLAVSRRPRPSGCFAGYIVPPGTRCSQPLRVVFPLSLPSSVFSLFLLFAAALSLILPASGRAESVPSIDLTRSPDYRQLATLSGTSDLAALRNSLGDALATNWVPAQRSRPGASGQERYAQWVDLYQWLDLLNSDESSVTKRWLSHHLLITEQHTEQGAHFQVAILDPGAPLSHEMVPPAQMEKLSADASMIDQVLGKLVAQPFVAKSGVLSGRLDPAFIAATLSDPDFLKRFSECFNEEDFAPKVLLNLEDIWRANRSDWHEFLPLALALSVVWDQPAPVSWPHHQVVASDVPRREALAADLFGEWVRAFRTGKLGMDLRQLGVDELKFVIDVPLDASEFDYVRSNPSLAHQDPQKAFESISYDRGRVIKNVYGWPWGAYRLSQIKERGGICVDQAYYAAITGKALGIPTIFFSGQGKDGGHAWIGYLKSPGRWDLNVARYAGQNYATGEALDPQTWSPITDHDLDLLTRHLGNHDIQDAARRDLVMASDFRRKGENVQEGNALESALLVCPENPSLWDAREEWLIRSGASVADLKAHHEAAIAQFSGFSDLKAQHQQALVRLALNSGEQKNAEQLSEQIVHENRGGWNARTDLSASAAWSLISTRLQTQDFSGAVEEFERQLHLQGERGGGDFFYKVVAPLTSELISAGHQDLALRILKESFNTLKPEKESLVDRDLRKLWQQAGGGR